MMFNRALHCLRFIETPANFKISWTSNFGSKIWAKLQVKPNFSSQFLRVNGILKFTSINLDFYFFVKGEEAWITVCLQLRDEVEAKELPSPLTIPCLPAVTRQSRSKAPYNVRGGMRKRFAPHVFYHYASVRQILKIYERTYHASKFSKLLRRVSKILKFVKTTKIYLFLHLKQRSKILIDINAIFFHIF